MLKTCLECLAGSRVENEVYGTVLNGQNSKAWPEPHLQNEIMFRLPRSLYPKDAIEITGQMNPNPEGSLFLNLITGTISPDYENIACQLEVDFNSQKILLRCIENGLTDNEVESGQKPSDLFPDSEFQFFIKVQENGEHLSIHIRESFIGSMELKHNLQDITNLTLCNITKVKELNFKYT